MKEFKTILASRRRELGLTLEEVGKAVGVSKGTIQRWEAGIISTPKMDKLQRLADVLRMPINQLVAGAELYFDDPTDMEILKKLGYMDDAGNVLQASSDEEQTLIRLYRGAEPYAQIIAVEILENHQRGGEG